MDENSAENKLDSVEYAEFKNNEQVKAIIAGQLAKHNVIKFGEIEIKIRSAIKKGLRDRIFRLAKEAQAGNMDNIDVGFYEVIAAMCIEEPWTKPEVWKMIDEETGMIPKVFEMIVEKVTGAEKLAQSFRRIP